MPDLFRAPDGPRPEGFLYRRGFLSEAEESDLIARFRRLPFRDFTFRGFAAKRRVVSYGWHYSFDSYRLSPAEPIPAFLGFSVERAANWIGCAPSEFAEALVTEYPAGAGIGWHKDVAPFDRVVGISLASSCRLRLRTGPPGARATREIIVEERSAYLLSGAARGEWEHHIPGGRALRYSLTLRTLKHAWKRRLDAAVRSRNLR